MKGTKILGIITLFSLLILLFNASTAVAACEYGSTYVPGVGTICNAAPAQSVPPKTPVVCEYGSTYVPEVGIVCNAAPAGNDDNQNDTQDDDAQTPVMNLTFTANPLEGNAPLKVMFNAKAEREESSLWVWKIMKSTFKSVYGYSFKFEWDFDGDGFTDLNQQKNTETTSVEYTYTIPGTYNIKVSVLDGISKTTKNITIIVNEEEPVIDPVIDPISEELIIQSFTANPSTVLQGESITLTAEIAGGIPSYTYTWDFDNDGNFDDAKTTTSETQSTQTISFNDIGDYPSWNYKINVKITDNNGSSKTASTLVTVKKEVETSFNVVVTPSKTSGEAPLIVEFQATASEIEGNNWFKWIDFFFKKEFKYSWDFNGDGNIDSSYTTYSSVSPIASYIYTTSGEYTAKVYVEYDGEVSIASTKITVGKTPVHEPEPEQEDSEDLVDMIIDDNKEGIGLGRITFPGAILQNDYSFPIIVNFDNNYDMDLEDVIITVSTDFGVIAKTKSFDVDSGDAKTSRMRAELVQKLPAGYYPMRIVISNDDFKIVRYRTLIVE